MSVEQRSLHTTMEGTSPRTHDTSNTVNGNNASGEESTASDSCTPLSTTIRRIRGNDVGQLALPSDKRSQQTIAEGTSPSTSGEVSHDASSTINGHNVSVNGSAASPLNRRIRTNKQWLIVGTRVSGPHGELVPNPKGHGRRVCNRAIGSIVASCESNKYKVSLIMGK